MKAANQAIRKHAKAGPEVQVSALIDLGLQEADARAVIRPDFSGRVGFPSYKLSSNSAEIARVKKRILDLAARANAPERAPIRGLVDGMDFEISESKEINRTQIRFPGKPSDAVRARLRAAGFVFSHEQQAWQRQLSNQAWHRAGQALGVAVG